jgi:hypothetical protein
MTDMIPRLNAALSSRYSVERHIFRKTLKLSKPKNN